MLIHNVTPFAAGYIHCSRQPPQSEMTFIVRGKFKITPGQKLEPLGLDTYLPEYMGDEHRREIGNELDRIAQGGLTGETFDEKAEDPSLAMPTYPGDFADFKPRADVMVKGTCYPPTGQETKCLVRFRVGSWLKELWVVGPRVWVDRIADGKKTDPLAFKQMPVDYAHAYGGAEYPYNPAGMGHATERLPSIEHVAAPKVEGEPAGFGPISSLWKLRADKRGTKYGADYLETRAPYYSEDFDWTYFNSAPPSQQLAGYLRGDEEVFFENMHPGAARLKVWLPGLRMRAFAKIEGKPTQSFAMQLDTLFADLDEQVIYLTWRGLIAVAQDDLSDVHGVLVASERLVDEPAPDAGYIEMLDKYVDDPVGTKAIYGDDIEGLRDDIDEGRDAAERVAEEGTGSVETFIEKRMAGMLGAEGVEAAKKLVRNTVGKALPDQRPQSRKNSSPAAALNALERRVHAAKADLAAEGADGSALDDVQARIDAAREQLGPGLGVAGTDEPAPMANCSAQDLADADLSGRQLRGINLAHANLTRANLRGADLEGADLSHAILYRADLRDANLSGAQLLHADLTLAEANGAKLTGVSCDHTIFRRTQLHGANLDEAHGKHPQFSKTLLSAASMRRVKFVLTMFERCILHEASFESASLSRCCFRNCEAHGASFHKAEIDGASVEGSSFEACNMTHMRGERTCWRNAKFDGCDVSFSNLPSAFFEGVSAAGARFYAAVLREARFYRANLRGATLEAADLFGADFRKASIHNARFTNANLYDAKFMQSAGADVDFAGAMLERANFQRCKVVRR